MRILVFAHVPPPFHGQSYMIQQMLEHLGKPGDKLVLYHINAQLSEGLADIGSWRLGKFLSLMGYIAEAWWMRWRYSIDAFYYVPAPAKRSAIYRDWMVLFLAAPLFKVRIFHWHATGLGQWVIDSARAGGYQRLESVITRRLLLNHDLSCVLNDWGRDDVKVFSPGRIAIVANGIPDPCTDFEASLLPDRHRRLKERRFGTTGRPVLFRLLYLAHATGTKGLFDSIEAVALANAHLQTSGGTFRVNLTVAGAFVTAEEEAFFNDRIAMDDLKLKGMGISRAISYAGFVEAADKNRLLRDTDGLCFPSFFPNEGQPVSVIEAFAYGMPVILSRWRALPEMISLSLSHLVEPHDPGGLMKAILDLSDEARFEEYRSYYLARYTSTAHSACLQEAILSVAD